MIYNFFRYLIWYIKFPKLFPNFFFQIINKFKNFIFNKKDIYLSNKYKSYLDNNLITNQTFLLKISKKKYENFYKSDLYKKTKKKFEKNNYQMGGAGNIDLLFNVSKIKKYKKFLDCGVAAGWSSLSILDGIKKKKFNKLISNDMPYMFRNNHNKVGFLIPKELKKKWQLYKMPDRLILKNIFKTHGKFDVCHYDSDKTYYGRLWSYKLIFKNLRHNGLLISDDINDNEAFIDFAKFKNKKIYIIKGVKNYVGVIIK